MKMMKLNLLCLGATAAVAAVLLLQVAAAAVGEAKPLLGGWKPLEGKELSDPYVKEIAAFAVDAYNKQSKSNLVLGKVVGGETQVVSGTNYKLILEINDGAPRRYEAVVWDKPWAHFRSLVSFKALPGDHA